MQEAAECVLPSAVLSAPCVTLEDGALERDDSAALGRPWELTLPDALLIRRPLEPHSAAVPPEPCGGGGGGWKDADAAIRWREGGRGGVLKMSGPVEEHKLLPLAVSLVGVFT